ncbi:peptidase [Aquibium carbonis]|uniref:Peptidase n=1 Tax=Aquibium carbonis TaxID=2495581 RepID=A0A429Z1G0_9HYPH|nr:Kazal-type serine protease inhibitor [Aquibium carbonis]RST87470.1 peptidase [Aquibium carbonis]
MVNSPVAGVAGLLALLFVSSCAVVVEEPLPVRPGPPSSQQLCPRIYDPVCARRGPDRQTFGNSCEANAAGYRVSHPGQCRRGGGPRPEPAPPPRQSFCTQQYEPVCARRGNQVRTFGNACEARNADYRILYDAPCR